MEDSKTLFSESLFTLRNFVSDVDDMIESISIHYSGFIVIYFDPNTSKESIRNRLKDYGINDFEFSTDNRQVFIYK